MEYDSNIDDVVVFHESYSIASSTQRHYWYLRPRVWLDQDLRHRMGSVGWNPSSGRSGWIGLWKVYPCPSVDYALHALGITVLDDVNTLFQLPLSSALDFLVSQFAWQSPAVELYSSTGFLSILFCIWRSPTVGGKAITVSQISHRPSPVTL